MNILIVASLILVLIAVFSGFWPLAIVYILGLFAIMSGTLQSEPSIAGSPYFGKWLGHAVVFIAFWSGTAGAAIAYGAIKGWNLPLFIVVAAAVVFLALLGRALVRTFNSGRSVVYWFGNR